MRALTMNPGLVDQAYRAILDAICRGRLKPGERLAQERLAEQLDVSRQPIGQALALLKAQGFVSDAGRRGLMVSPIDPGFAASLYEFRGAVEGLAARKAAERGASVDAAREILVQGRAAVAARSIEALIDADMAFHGLVTRLADNPIVTDSMAHHWNHTRRLMRAILTIDGDWPARVWREHAAILDAIGTGDGARAEALVRVHVTHAAAALLARIEGGRDDAPIAAQG